MTFSVRPRPSLRVTGPPRSAILALFRDVFVQALLSFSPDLAWKPRTAPKNQVISALSSTPTRLNGPLPHLGIGCGSGFGEPSISRGASENLAPLQPSKVLQCHRS